LISLFSGAKYNDLISVPGMPAKIIACVMPVALNRMMFVNHIAINVVNTAQIHSWWHDINARSNPAQRISAPPCVYISVANI
jgi:hypothetical protein